MATAWRMSRPPRTSSSTALSSWPLSDSVLVEHRMEQRLVAEPGGLGAEDGPGPHAALVAGDGVDLTVVAQHPKRLSPFPCGQGVGREPLVEHGEMGRRRRARPGPGRTSARALAATRPL